MTDLTGRTYSFDVTIELNDELAFVPGELGTYLTDGLFELDRADLLFPGLKNPKPGERVLSVGFHQTGYDRRPSTPVDAKPTIINTVGSDEQRALLSSLEDAALRVSDLLRDLRLIKAKAHGMLDNLGANAVWTKAQTKHAKALLAALESAFDSHATHIKPLL